MQILPINISSNKYQNKTSCTQPVFERRGKPIELNEIVKKHPDLLPERVLVKAKEYLAKKSSKMPTIMYIHKEIYTPILACKTLEEAKLQFPEFAKMKETVFFERNSRYAKEFKERTDKDFALKMLQEFWGNLKTKEEIAKDLGMTSRTSLEWPLHQIQFVSYPANYKTLLKASDPEGNKIIASKTTAYNQLNPEWKAKLNQMGADAWKNNEELKKAQSERMHNHDIDFPERIEKISAHSKAMWDACPEVKQAMSDFIAKEPPKVRRIFAKKIQKYPLRAAERRMIKGVYDRFWEANPEYKKQLSEASKAVSLNKKK